MPRPQSGAVRRRTRGYADGQYNLGVMYYLGQGVPKDYVQAYKWFDLAAGMGISDAKKAREQP